MVLRKIPTLIRLTAQQWSNRPWGKLCLIWKSFPCLSVLLSLITHNKRVAAISGQRRHSERYLTEEMAKPYLDVRRGVGHSLKHVYETDRPQSAQCSSEPCREELSLLIRMLVAGVFLLYSNQLPLSLTPLPAPDMTAGIDNLHLHWCSNWSFSNDGGVCVCGDGGRLTQDSGFLPLPPK